MISCFIIVSYKEHLSTRGSCCIKQHVENKTSCEKLIKVEKLYIPLFVCELMFLYCIIAKSSAKTGRIRQGLTNTHPHLAAHKHTQDTHPHWVGHTHAQTSLSCSISLSLCSISPSSWWMVISASASRLVRSWSSSVARDDRPLLCNISSNFFMDSSLLENVTDSNATRHTSAASNGDKH